VEHSRIQNSIPEIFSHHQHSGSCTDRNFNNDDVKTFKIVDYYKFKVSQNLGPCLQTVYLKLMPTSSIKLKDRLQVSELIDTTRLLVFIILCCQSVIDIGNRFI
jgi:hypothetical protein